MFVSNLPVDVDENGVTTTITAICNFDTWVRHSAVRISLLINCFDPMSHSDIQCLVGAVQYPVPTVLVASIAPLKLMGWHASTNSSNETATHAFMPTPPTYETHNTDTLFLTYRADQDAVVLSSLYPNPNPESRYGFCQKVSKITSPIRRDQ